VLAMTYARDKIVLNLQRQSPMVTLMLSSMTVRE